MPVSPHLNDELLQEVRGILDRVRAELNSISQGDAKTLHHLRRYLMKRLEFDERGTPSGSANVLSQVLKEPVLKAELVDAPVPRSTPSRFSASTGKERASMPSRVNLV